MATNSGIAGITESSLWTAWKAVRKALRHATVRDVVDFLDYDVDPDVWIGRLLEQLKAGTYEPRAPQRFPLAKSKGFSRRITTPNIRDLVLYRAIVDYCYQRAKRTEGRHVYFERARLAAVTNAAGQSAALAIADAAIYGSPSQRRWLAWLHYDEYRRRLIHDRVHPFIVLTDITNFFDSVLYSRIADAVSKHIDSRLVGLLFFLLERLSIREAFSESPRVGLPVDEYDCSRKLAHLVLFPHDRRMIEKCGEGSYVRWMDDQNIGVQSRAEGYRTLAFVGESLSRLHLTPNAGKSQVLSLAEARRHFHFDTNARLRRIDARQRPKTKSQRESFRRELLDIWMTAKDNENDGEWEKILKWFYRLAAIGRSRRFRKRAQRDMLKFPSLTSRIADYMLVTGTPGEYFDFAERAWSNDAQVYPDVNYVLVDRLLRLEADEQVASRIRRLAVQLLDGRGLPVVSIETKALAPLLMLRFADRRSLPRFKRLLEAQPERVPGLLLRSVAVVFASYGYGEFQTVRKIAGRALDADVSEMIKLIERVRVYDTVPDRFKFRINAVYDPVADREYVDMRGLLAARLLGLSNRPPVRAWLLNRKAFLSSKNISSYDRGILGRMFPK
jgi:hypothetical protein